ncbi:MAG TPA: M56 family metallopeptidase [Allosphingosinicella sp.]|jgi:beta-lactamase regulating signal transducer with metallopeptidase domain
MTSWFFIEMAAKSALICSLALLLAMLLRQRAAADRAMVLRVGVALLLALPLIDLAFPILQVEAFAAPALVETSLSPAEMERLLAIAAALPPVEPSIWDDPAPLIIILWAAGALAVVARLAVGLVTLSRWTRSAEPVTDPAWLASLERARTAAGAPDNLRLMVADHVPGPLGWGWRNPVILIDYDTYAEPDEADAILAHEVAHVARRDWPALMLTRLATALFWFNPLIWTLAREVIQQAEEAADAHAARVVEPTRYAETLLVWGQIGRGIGVPANSIAPGARALSRRVRAVLEPRLLERSAGSRLAVVAMLLCIGVAAPIAALELVEAARPAQPASPVPPLAAAAIAQPDAPRAPALPGEPAEPLEADGLEAPEAPELPNVHVDVAPALESLREVLPRIPHIVARSLRAIDAEALARAIRASNGAHVDAAQLQAAMAQLRAHMPDAEAIRVEVEREVRRINPAELEAQIRASMPDHAAIERQVRAAMRASRSGMLQGADGMERGAEQMEAQARRFRDRQERERIIARERARGRDVSHEDLLEAAQGMEEGARGMREGARDMRRSIRESSDRD